MKHAALACCALATVLAAGCRRPHGSAPAEVLVLCGGSMRAPLEACVAEYAARRPDVKVLTTYGGSGELCAQIQETGRGDVYLCHDPFMPWATEKGFIAEWSNIARLSVVLMVPRANPHGIATLRDLARPGLRLGIGDQTHSTSGQIVKHLLKHKDYGAAVLTNVVMETKGHQQRCNDVILGTLDATLVWDAVAYLYRDRATIIPIDAEMEGVDALTSPTYKRSDLRNTKVTVGLLAGAKDRPAARDFYAFMVAEGPRIFAAQGFSPPVN